MKYIIVARDPLRRAVSAFNWRYKQVVTDKLEANRFPGERDVLERYGSIDALGKALYDENDKLQMPAFRDARNIHHIREDVRFYLTELLNRCDPDQIEAVIMQEDMGADIRRVFGIKCRQRHNVNKGHITLSARARANLIRFFQRDYEAMARLYAWGKIDRNIYLKAMSRPLSYGNGKALRQSFAALVEP